MAHVFISYSREDREAAKRLAEAIESRGWTVWWDRFIPAGKSYEEVIEQAIDEARCVVVLWTRHSVASGWVRNEAAEGARRNVLIPIRLEDVRVPLALRHLQTDDIFEWTSAELENCLVSIEAMIGPASRLEPQRPMEPKKEPPPAPAPPPAKPPPTTTAVSPAKPRRRLMLAGLAGGLLFVLIVSMWKDQKVPSTDTAATQTTDTGVTVDTVSTSATSTDATTTDAAVAAALPTLSASGWELLLCSKGGPGDDVTYLVEDWEARDSDAAPARELIAAGYAHVEPEPGDAKYPHKLTLTAPGAAVHAHSIKALKVITPNISEVALRYALFMRGTMMYIPKDWEQSEDASAIQELVKGDLATVVLSDNTNFAFKVQLTGAGKLLYSKAIQSLPQPGAVH